MNEPHLHNRIGDAVRDCKDRLYTRLKAGANDVETEIARFMAELDLALETAIREQ